MTKAKGREEKAAKKAKERAVSNQDLSAASATIAMKSDTTPEIPPRRQGIACVEEGQAPWHASPTSLTLCVTDSVFTGYRQNRKPIFEPNQVFSNSIMQ